MQSSLGRAIHRQWGNTQLSSDATNVDDTSSARHVRKCCLNEEEGSSNVGVEHLVPRLGLDACNVGVSKCDACVVDDDVDSLGVETV